MPLFKVLMLFLGSTRIYFHALMFKKQIFLTYFDLALSGNFLNEDYCDVYVKFLIINKQLLD